MKPAGTRPGAFSSANAQRGARIFAISREVAARLNQQNHWEEKEQEEEVEGKERRKKE